MWHRFQLRQKRAFALGVTPPPPGISELGEEVWRGDKPPAERGLVVLGTIGHPDFAQAWAAERMQEERKLLQQLPELPDPQCSWLLLSTCTPLPEPIMRFARCPRPSHEGTPLRTTKLSGKRCRLAWEVPP